MNALRDPKGYRTLMELRGPWSGSLADVRKVVQEVIGRDFDSAAPHPLVRLGGKPWNPPGPVRLVQLIERHARFGSLRLDPDRWSLLYVYSASDFWHRWLIGTEK